jgi:hypothetical protein
MYTEGQPGTQNGNLSLSEESPYLHLVVNFLEYAVLREVLGVDRARRVIEYWVGN